MPATVSRRRIQSGAVTAGSIPRTSRAANRSQPTGSAHADRVRRLRGRAGRVDARRRVAERHAERVRQLPGQPAHRVAVPPVGGDLQLDHDVVQADQRPGLVTRLPAALGGSTMMPAWSSQMPSSRPEQIMPSERWPVGLAGGDGEAARQHRAGQGHHDQVAGGEVGGAADDRRAAPRSPTSTGQYRIGFLNSVSSSVGEHPADHQRTLHAGPQVGDLLDLDAQADQGALQRGRIGRRVDILAQPGDRYPHAQLTHPERPGEPGVALDHVVHVADPVAEHQGALDAHAEREAGVDLRVDAAGAQHPRVDHAAAAPLDPARAVAVLGEPHVELGRRLGEREVVRPPAGPRLGAEHGPGEVVQRAAQVRHGDALVHHQALDLVEDRGVGGVQLVGAVGAPGHDHVDRRLPGQHGAGLHRRGVGPQHQAGGLSATM